MQKAKIINLVITNIMNGLFREKDGDKSWTHPFLQLVYQGFNAPNVSALFAANPPPRPKFDTMFESQALIWDLNIHDAPQPCFIKFSASKKFVLY